MGADDAISSRGDVPSLCRIKRRCAPGPRASPDVAGGPASARIKAMAIHQIQLRYDPAADRLLLQLRSSEAEIYAAWLTRRMVSRVLPPFRQAVLQAGVACAAPRALPVPEARQMLEQAALQRPLPGAEFGQPFKADDGSYPLGTEPLLPDAADLRPGADGQITLALRETRGRRIDLLLTADLSTALLRLIDGALKTADWGLDVVAGRADAADEPPLAGPPAGHRIN